MRRGKVAPGDLAHAVPAGERIARFDPSTGWPPVVRRRVLDRNIGRVRGGRIAFYLKEAPSNFPILEIPFGDLKLY